MKERFEEFFNTLEKVLNDYEAVQLISDRAVECRPYRTLGYARSGSDE